MMLLIDGAVAVGLVWMALRALNARRLTEAVIVFIGFTGVMALAWVRLRAPDLALAEAAVGAGVLVVVLLDGLGRLAHLLGGRTPLRAAAVVLLPLLSLALVAVLLRALGDLPSAATGLGPRVFAALEQSGVENPVTAVLLNFRGFDTLLEVFVLLGAAVAVALLRPLDRALPRGAGPITAGPPQTPMADWYRRRLLPVALLVAVYLLWAGGSAPGGAFQAGSLLAGVLALGLLTGTPLAGRPAAAWAAAAIGPVAFVLAALLFAVGGHGVLQYPPGWAKAAILGLESLLTVSIAAALTLLVIGIPRRRRP